MKKYRICIIILIVTLMLFLSGCDKKIKNFLNVNVKAAFSARVTANIELFDKLVASGLLSKDERDVYVDSMISAVESYLNGISGDTKEAGGTEEAFYKAIVDWKVYEDDTETKNYDEELFTNYVVSKAKSNNEYTKELKKISLFKYNADIVPIELVNDTAGNKINERLTYEVYVLKPDIQSDGGYTELAGIMEDIKKATANNSSIDTGTLDKYFIAAKEDTDGDGVGDRSVTLLDYTSKQYKVVSNTYGSQSVNSANKVVAKKTANSISFSCNYVNEAGKDMIIYNDTGSQSFPVLAVRLKELNAQAINNIIATLGTGADKYVFVNNRVYLMQYPVYYISKIEDTSDRYDNFECEYEQSVIQFNLLTGAISYTNKDSGETTIINSNEPYLTSNSFVLFNNTDNLTVKVGHSGVGAKSGIIILRDYLETVFSPNIVEGENIVAFGRKIRWTRFSGNKGNEIGKYYSIDGNILNGVSSVFVSDIADSDKLTLNTPYIQYIGKQNERAVDNIDEDEINYDEYVTNTSGLFKYPVNNISAAFLFPSNKIALEDNNSDEKHIMYAMATKNGLFDAGLYSGWINNDSKTESIEWWNSWLKNNGYKYSISRLILDAFMAKNYTFELQKEGYVILDLDTVKKIQKDYSKDERAELSKTMRTAFVLLGVILLIYMLLLVGAWAVDTNVDLGVNILTKLTFGHWVAIKDVKEVGYKDTKDIKYITFQKLIGKAVLLAILGAALLSVNIVEIVVFLVKAFGGIASEIGKLLSGIDR